MTDGPERIDEHHITVEKLAEQFRSLQEEARRSQTEIVALKAEVARLSGAAEDTQTEGRVSLAGHAGHHVVDDEAADGVGPLSRRGALLALGGAAAGGVGMAIGSAFLGAEPAAATQGSAVLAGDVNTATATTEITTTTGNGLSGYTNGGSGAFGLYGSAGGTGSGVYGTVNAGPSGQLFAQRAGVIGDSGSTDGVIGLSLSNDGVLGSSNNGNGVHGVGYNTSDLTLPTRVGVLGESLVANGVVGLSAESSGVLGVNAGTTSLGGQNAGVACDSNSGFGVVGSSSANSGVQGFTSSDGAAGVGGLDSSPDGGFGVAGSSASGIGVYGSLNAGVSGLRQGQRAAVMGDSASTPGVIGLSGDSDGVRGGTAQNSASGVIGSDSSVGGGFGVTGQSNQNIGVYGTSGGGPGVLGMTTVISQPAVEAANTAGGPSLLLNPAGATLPAAAAVGQFIVLADGSLHYAYQANEWVPLTNGVFPITPVRVINTPPVSGGSTGPWSPTRPIPTIRAH